MTIREQSRTDTFCAICVKERRSPWGALCLDCEEIVADFTPEEWARIEAMDNVEAARYVLNHPNREQARRAYYQAFDLCPFSELDIDECPHCTGDMSGLETS